MVVSHVEGDRVRHSGYHKIVGAGKFVLHIDQDLGREVEVVEGELHVAAVDVPRDALATRAEILDFASKLGAILKTFVRHTSIDLNR